MIQVQFGVAPNEVSFENWRKMNSNPNQLLNNFVHFDKETLNLEAYKVVNQFF